MFDDDQKNSQVNPPGNLPIKEPEDMFAAVDSGDAVSGNMTAAPAVNKIPDALSAGVLKPATPINPETVLSGNNIPIDSPSAHSTVASPAPGSPHVTGPQIKKAFNIGGQTDDLNQTTNYKVKQPFIGKLIFFVLVIVILAALVVGGIWAYNTFYKTSEGEFSNNVNIEPAITTASTISQPEQQVETKLVVPLVTSTDSIENEIKTDKILLGEPIDSDNDGLDDIREKQLKTDPNKKDTDNDGLTDGDEVFIWKTNPLNDDTDGDTYKDGHEIQNGYNPIGPGKLINIPQSKEISTTSTETSTSSTILNE